MKNATELSTYITNDSKTSKTTSNSIYTPIEQSSNSNNTNNTNKKELIESINNQIELPYKNSDVKEKMIPVNSDKLMNILDNEPPKYYFYKKIGNSYSYFGNRYGDPLIIIGPNWQLYIFLSSFISIIYYFSLISFWNTINYIPKLIGIIIYLIFILSYTYTVLINPGYPKHDIDSIKGEPRNQFDFCYDCKMWVNKEKNVEHCIVCDICVEENDHHCIWASKCIGKNNIYSFKIFVLFTFLALIYGMIMLIIAKISFLSKSEQKL
jgi:hypothetical protein